MASSSNEKIENSFIIQLDDAAVVNEACENAIVKGAEKVGCDGIVLKKLGGPFVNIRCATSPTDLTEAQLKKGLADQGVAVKLVEQDSMLRAA